MHAKILWLMSKRKIENTISKELSFFWYCVLQYQIGKKMKKRKKKQKIVGWMQIKIKY